MAGAAALLAAACSLAHAGDGMAVIDARTELNPAQLDRVAAGLQQSGSAASAGALLGFATTASTTYAAKTGPIQSTSSTSVGVAGGIGATATATAATRFR